MRLGELYGLRWTDVNLDQGLISVRRSYRSSPKSGKARHVPINPRLLPLLRPHLTRGAGVPQPARPGQARGRDAPRSDAEQGRGVRVQGGDRGGGLPRHRRVPRANRHTFASHFMMAGGNILTLQRLLGHSSVAVTMKYAHLAPDFMRDEVGRMSFESHAAVVLPLAR
jgi:integrase